MSDLHELCMFGARPIAPAHLDQLRHYLRSGIPATYTIEEADHFVRGVDAEPSSTTTPLHLICALVPEDASAEEMAVVSDMVATLLEYGAGWSLADAVGNTPGCVLVKRGMKLLPLYRQLVEAGVRAELLLRKVLEYDVEFVSDDEIDAAARPRADDPVDDQASEEARAPGGDEDPADAPSHNQAAYLATKLEYTDDALVTAERKDGVMMAWETLLMKLGSEALFSQADEAPVVLNIGFGMGIIDGFIQARRPATHYICEAHPDVLAKLRRDGWYDKPNVIILEGRWQHALDDLLSKGVMFDGIYYDTFSEHYADMLELYDYVVGMLKPRGVFSFFNGLGADREVVYDVYKRLVELDLANYGLQCTFDAVTVPESQLQAHGDSVWSDVKRLYWACPVYYHPTARFMDFDE